MASSIIIKLAVGTAVTSISTAVAYFIAHKAKNLEFSFFGCSVKASNNS